ncbi:MAG: Gfo/Idh/MocA family protein, partial [Aestuariivirgaceae bacterium]
MQKLRIGLVGAGLVGQAEHAYYLGDDSSRFEFVGLADASATVRSAVAKRYGIRSVHTNIDELLATGIEAVVIAAPDAFHPALAVKALDAGLHVLCEKPLALTVAGCDAIAAARDRSGRIVQVAYMKRYDPAYRQALTYL